MWKSKVLLGVTLLASQTFATCYNPEPASRICYNSNGATPQNVTLQEIQYTAKYLCYYGSQKGSPAFYTMKVKDADDCAEWQVTSKGSTLVLAKLVGNQDAEVTFNDIANTIAGGVNATPDEQQSVLYGCGSAGGQMGVQVNSSDPNYSSPGFINGGFTNQGIVIKIVHNAGS
jgi:hypothetical protein